jgi:DNA-binding transcriptional ArsR family regulator
MHMAAVTRLRTRRDAHQENGIARLKAAILDASDAVPANVLGRVVHLLDRELSSRRSWEFVMIEAHLYAKVTAHLASHSRRPIKALRLWAELFAVLPPDSNEVLADRAELARRVGIEPGDVSKIMRELEAIGAIYKQREGRGVRYFVNPMLGTHLAGAARDKAQAEAPRLQIVEIEPG